MTRRSRKVNATGLTFDVAELNAVINDVSDLPKASSKAFAIALEKGLNDGKVIAAEQIGKTLYLESNYILSKLTVKINRKSQQGALQAALNPVLLTRYPHTQNRSAPTQRIVTVKQHSRNGATVRSHKRTVLSTTAGYNIKVRKSRGAERWPGAFVINATRGKVGTSVLVTRKGKNRNPMRALYGPSVGTSLDHNADIIQPKVADRIQQRYLDALDREL